MQKVTYPRMNIRSTPVLMQLKGNRLMRTPHNLPEGQYEVEPPILVNFEGLINVPVAHVRNESTSGWVIVEHAPELDQMNPF